MSRLHLIGTSLLLAFGLVIFVGIASGETVPTMAFQESTAEEEPAPVAAPPVTPLAGTAEVSPTEPWVTEVRVPVIIENVTPFTLSADMSLLGGLTFSLRDPRGNLYSIDSAHPDRGMQPNHSLRVVEPAQSERWVLGFRVPTAMATDLTLELRSGGTPAADWPLANLPSSVTIAPAGAAGGDTVSLGQAFAWDEGVTATATEVGSLVCGDPNIETVTQVVAVAFTVTNERNAEVRWPGYIHRDGGSVAEWSDGTAAEMSMETFVGNAETLPRVSTSAVRLPAHTESRRALVFAAPRDGRFTDTSTLPAAIRLRTGHGDLPLGLVGATATLPMSPGFCDLGFFGAPLPYAFSPGAKFTVGGEAAGLDAAAADEAARALLTEALAGAALYYDTAGESFATVSANDLVARAPGVTFVAHDVGDDIPGDLGAVYFSPHPDEDDFLYVTTRAASGRWFCAGADPHTSIVTSNGFDLAEVSEVCFPESQVDEDG